MWLGNMYTEQNNVAQEERFTKSFCCNHVADLKTIGGSTESEKRSMNGVSNSRYEHWVFKLRLREAKQKRNIDERRYSAVGLLVRFSMNEIALKQKKL
jgi:hypothetical protein